MLHNIQINVFRNSLELRHYLGQFFSWWSDDQQILSLSRMLAQPCLREVGRDPQCPGLAPLLLQEVSFQSRQVLHEAL